MSVDAIKAALQTAIEALSPTLPPAYEGNAFEPTVGQPHQRIDFVWAEPENNENNAVFRQGGMLQVTLKYPAGVGSGALDTRAILVRAAFPRGRALTSGAVVTTIEKTPAIIAGPAEGSWIVRFVRIRFYANGLA